MHFILQVESIEDDDGEELGYFEFDLVNGANLQPPWYDGVVIEPGPLPISLTLNDVSGWACKFADYYCTPVPLASSRLKAAFEAAGVTNVQWFETIVTGVGNRDAPAYFAMNIVGSVSAADPQKSRSTRILGVPGADIFDDLVLVEKHISGLTLFRLAESVTTIVASDAVKRSVESAGIDTVGFFRVKCD